MSKLNVDEIRSADRSASDSANITLTDAGFTVTNFIGFSARVTSTSGGMAGSNWTELGSASDFGSGKWTADINIGTEFGVNTGRYTPTVAGVYLFTASYDHGRLDANQNVYTLIAKNKTGANVAIDTAIAFERQHLTSGLSNQGQGMSLSGIASMNGSSDYVSMFIYHTYSSTTTANTGTKFSATFLGKT